MDRAAQAGETTPRVPRGGRRAVLVVVATAAAALATAGVLAQREVGAIPADVRATWDRAPPAAIRVVAPGRPEVVATSPAEADWAAQREAPGARIEVDGLPVTLVEELPLLAFLATLASVLACAGVAGAALASRTAQPGALALYAAFLATAIAVGTGGVYPPRSGFGAFLASADLVALAALPAFFLRAATTFARPRSSGGAAARAVLAVSVGAAGTAVWNVLAWSRLLADPAAGRWSALAAPTKMSEALLVVGMGLGCVALANTARRTESALERAQAKWLLVGIALAATPFVFLRALPRLLLGVESPVTPAVDRLVELAAPFAVAIAVVRHRLFDVDVIIRRGLLYTSLAVALVGLFLAGSLAATSWIDRDARLAEVLRGLAWALPVAVFVPLRRGLARWIDRAFFRLRADHQRAVEGAEPALLAAATPAEAAGLVLDLVRRALDPVRVGALVLGPPEEVVGDFPLAVLRAARPAVERGPAGSADATAFPELEGAWPVALEVAGARFAQPLAHAGTVLGAILLSEKRSGRRLVEEDLALLARASAACARALDRIALVRRAAEEAAARRTAAALEAEKSEFLMQVAHDLRTPIVGVLWTARNVADGVTGPVTAAQAQALLTIDALARRLDRLVTNLLDLARLRVGGTPPPPRDVDLCELAADVAASLSTAAGAKRVTVRLPARNGLPPVRGRPERLASVLTNLLDNAIKYSPAGAEVDVSMGRDADGWVWVAVRDRGPGLPESEREAVFDLFRRGAPTPHGSALGFGIGLHVAKSWTEAAGGRVSAENHPDGGALFLCRFPAAGGAPP